MRCIRRHNQAQTNRRGIPSRRLRALSGMVIVELIGVIAVMSMLLAVIVTLFAAVYRIDRSWRESAVEGRELNRLAVYFREDAHRAGDVRIAEGSGSWSFILGDGGRVDYEVVAEGVRRTVRAASDEGASFVQRQELGLPAAATIHVQDRQFADGRLLTLRVATDAESTDGDGRVFPLRVDAQLGRFHLERSEQSRPVE